LRAVHFPPVGNSANEPLLVEAVMVTTANTQEGRSMAGLLSVSEAARRLGANPKDISDLFYRRDLRDDLCPIVGGRRLIPDGYVSAIEAALKRRGKPLNQRHCDPD